MKVWDWAGIKLMTPGSAISLAQTWLNNLELNILVHNNLREF